jgi:hypothetical protein
MHSVYGPTVLMAKHLQERCPPSMMLVSEETYQRLSSRCGGQSPVDDWLACKCTAPGPADVPCGAPQRRTDRSDDWLACKCTAPGSADVPCGAPQRQTDRSDGDAGIGGSARLVDASSGAFGQQTDRFLGDWSPAGPVELPGLPRTETYVTAFGSRADQGVLPCSSQTDSEAEQRVERASRESRPADTSMRREGSQDGGCAGPASG